MSSFNFVKAVRQISMPSTTKLVAITLASYANYETGECFPSVQTLMEDTGLSNRVVGLHIKHIEKLGILVVDRSNGRRSSYRFDVENLKKVMMHSHKLANASSDFKNKTSDSDDIKPVTLMHQPVTLVQKAVTQSHTNYQEQPIELSKERSSNTHDEKISPPPIHFVQYYNFDLAKISVIELGQKYPTLKLDFIELSKPRHPDLEQQDIENLFDEFGDWFASSNDYGKQISKSAQKWAVSWLTWVNNNKHKVIARKTKVTANEQTIVKQQVSAQPSAYQAKQENVNRWKNYGKKIREERYQESSIIDVVPVATKNFLIDEVGHA